MHEISIILPVYNGIKYIQQCITSVLNQDHSKFEFLIIDDCSTDGSWEYLQSLKDDRIKLFKNDVNKGLFFNLNFLIQHTTSSRIKLWAQDDVMHTNCIKEIIEFHIENPQIGFSYTGCDYINENSINNSPRNDTTPSIISTELHAYISFSVGSISSNIANVTLNKSALEKVGYFNEN